METGIKFKTVDEYIGTFPVATKKIMQQVRKTIIDAAPEAEEVISYNMPAYKQEGMLVFFAAYKEHIGFYPTPGGIEAFKKELSVYNSAKGSVQFPIDKPMPLALITKIVKYRVKENLKKASLRKKK
jgi:uncharacterized protein YdhG (YjbR/CyaY superfamily)